VTAQASWSDGSAVEERGDVEVVHGFARIAERRGELEALAQRCDAPATARSTWILASIAGPARSWAAFVRDSAGFLRAAAVLVDSPTAPSSVVTLAGTGAANQGHRGALLAEDAGWARQLGVALRLSLSVRSDEPATELGPIPADAAGLDELLAGFPGLVASPVDPIPMLRREPGVDDAQAYLSGAMRRNLRKANNRLATDGRTFEVRFARSHRDVASLLPSIEACHRGRDHDRGIASDLDDEGSLTTWRRRLLALASDGLLEVSTAYIDGSIAAHVVGLRDRTCYRVLEGHYAIAWSRYAPGRLLETAVIQRMLDERAMTALDWMTSLAPDSLVAQNDAEQVVVLRAVPARWSPPEPRQG
jgi:hypothetical protein